MVVSVGVLRVPILRSVFFEGDSLIYYTYIISFTRHIVKSFLSEIGKGIEPHPTDEYHLSILSYLLVI